jgi:hypothetical protein
MEAAHFCTVYGDGGDPSEGDGDERTATRGMEA